MKLVNVVIALAVVAVIYHMFFRREGMTQTDLFTIGIANLIWVILAIIVASVVFRFS
jgi:hypothetical protein